MRTFCFCVCLCLSFIFYTRALGQDPLRFSETVAELKAEMPESEDHLIIFTGSSSIRMWKDVADRYPDYNIVNRGFGGSQMSDLLYFLDDLVINSNPCQVFIYEGDNDISAGKSNEQILTDAEMVFKKIWAANPDTEIVLISPKPSVARWNLKEQYLALNKSLAARADSDPKLKFVDVWTPVLDDNGLVRSDIFLKDNLHMNEKGYAVWEETIRPFLRSCK